MGFTSVIEAANYRLKENTNPKLAPLIWETDNHDLSAAQFAFNF